MFIQKRVPLEANQRMYALMASGTRSNLNQKLHVKTILEDTQEEINSLDSDTSGEETRAEGDEVTQDAEETAPAIQSPVPSTPLSQASTKMMDYSVQSDLIKSDYLPLTQPPAQSPILELTTKTYPLLLAVQLRQKDVKEDSNKDEAKLPSDNEWSKKGVVLGILKNAHDYDGSVGKSSTVRERVLSPPHHALPNRETLYPSLLRPKANPNPIPIPSWPSSKERVSSDLFSLPNENNIQASKEDQKPAFELHTPSIRNSQAAAGYPPSDPPGDSSSDDSKSIKKKTPKASKKANKSNRKKQPLKVPTIPDDDDDGSSGNDGSNGSPSEEENASSEDEAHKILKCPSVETLTRILVKHARKLLLRNLDYPPDLNVRRRHFNSFIDILSIVCKISQWTRSTFKDWPAKVNIEQENVNIAFFNLVFTHANEACQKHLLEDCDSCAIKAIQTLQRHCAPITDDHIEKMDIQFRSLAQGENEVATSYFNRIRETKRDCYHAGISLSSLELLSRAIRGASNHHLYDTTYKIFERKFDDYRMDSENPCPTFIELEMSLSRINERRSLTVPGQTSRNYNQHGAYTAIGQNTRDYTRRNSYAIQTSKNTPFRRPPGNSIMPHTRRQSSGSTTRHCTHCNRPGHNFAECRTSIKYLLLSLKPIRL
jgi:hypothetical protein